VQDQAVAVQVLAPAVGCAGRPCGQLRARLGRLRRRIEIAPPDAREAPKIEDDGGAQLIEQPRRPGPPLAASVRQALLAASPRTSTVSVEALKWGFWHFGEFSNCRRRRCDASTLTSLGK
jgi:hypothetical protein